MKRQRSTPITKPITPTGYQLVYTTADKQIAEGNSQGKLFNIIQWYSRNSNSHFARNFVANGELAIRGTKLTLNAEINLLIEQLLLGEQYCIQ